MNTYDKKDQLQGAYQPTQTGTDQNAEQQNVSGWNTQMQNIMQEIQNRPNFKFDLNGDALYQQYKDQFTNLGKLAMQDTIGKAAGLTGGYGNTYAQNAGQQQYNAYLDRLNDVIPDIYAQQRAAYDAEGDKLYNQFNLANAMYGNAQAAEQQAYERGQADRAAADDKVVSLIQMGIMPSEADMAASSYSPEEISAMKKWFANQNAAAGSSGSRSSGGSSRGSSGNGKGNDNGNDNGDKYTNGELMSRYSAYQNGGVSASAMEQYVAAYAAANGLSENDVWKMLAPSNETSNYNAAHSTVSGGDGYHDPLKNTRMYT